MDYRAGLTAWQVPCAMYYDHVPYTVCYVLYRRDPACRRCTEAVFPSRILAGDQLEKGAVDADVANSNSIGRLGAAMEGNLKRNLLKFC